MSYNTDAIALDDDALQDVDTDVDNQAEAVQDEESYADEQTQGEDTDVSFEDLEQEEGEESEPAGGSSGSDSRQSATRKTQVRRIAARALSLSEASQEDLDLLGTIFKVTPNVLTLTVETVVEGAGAFKNTTPLRKLLDSQDQMDAMMVALDMDDATLKYTWNLAALLGVDLPSRMPANDNKACRQLAQDVSSADKAKILARLDDVRALIN